MSLTPGDESHWSLEHHVEGLHEHRRAQNGSRDVFRGYKLPLEAGLLAERPHPLGLRLVGYEGRAVDELLHARRAGCGEEAEVALVLHDLGASPPRSRTQFGRAHV